LKRSNGSPQARQRCRALHGVEPKRLISSVSVEAQRRINVKLGVVPPEREDDARRAALNCPERAIKLIDGA